LSRLKTTDDQVWSSGDLCVCFSEGARFESRLIHQPYRQRCLKCLWFYSEPTKKWHKSTLN